MYTNGQHLFKKIEYIRFPLALGRDVFLKDQYISSANEQNLIQLLQAFKTLITLYEVDDYKICATSAWREAKNKLAIKANVEKALGVAVHIIDGDEEAGLINKAIQFLVREKHYMHIDVGGGSTEISFYKEQQKVSAASFKLGSLRNNLLPEVRPTWAAMERWIHAQKQHYRDKPVGIATGGNIRKLVQLAGGNGKKFLSLKRLVATQKYLATYTLEERIHKLQLNPDRAELILPATQIYLTALQWGGIKHTLAPEIGLKDGIIRALYEKHIAS